MTAPPLVGCIVWGLFDSISFVLKILDILVRMLGCLASKWRFFLLGFIDSADIISLQMTHCGFAIPASTIKVNPYLLFLTYFIFLILVSPFIMGNLKLYKINVSLVDYYN